MANAKQPKKQARGAASAGKQPAATRSDRDRRVRQHDRIARVLNILNLIQSRGRWNAQAIAEELGCSQRTVYRDLQVLEFAGVPWFYDEQDGCYRVRADFRLPTITLTDDELLDQSLAATLSQDDRLAIGGGAKRLVKKVVAGASDHAQRLMADAEHVVETFNLMVVDHSRHTETIKTVQRALIDRRVLTGTYASPYETRTRRLTIHPYRLCLVKQAWYLIGRLSTEQSPKTFRIARFKSLRASARPAEVLEEFDLRAYFGNAWGAYRGARSHRVTVVFTPEAGRCVVENQWHPTQKSTLLTDGSVAMEFQVDGLAEILHWLLSYAGKVRIDAPEELRRCYVTTLKEATRMQGAVIDDSAEA